MKSPLSILFVLALPWGRADLFPEAMMISKPVASAPFFFMKNSISSATSLSTAPSFSISIIWVNELVERSIAALMRDNS